MRLLQPVEAIGGFYDDLNQWLWPSLAPELFGPVGVEGFLGAGSMLGTALPRLAATHVFSSGAGDRRVLEVPNPRVWCVRGPISARLLGVEVGLALTDGAILAPVARPATPRQVGACSIGVMPRFESLLHPGWVDSCDIAGYTLISPVGPPDAVIEQVLSTELLLAETLHGAVLADTFGIPWLPFATTGGFRHLAWADWAASLPMALDVVAVPPPCASPLLAEGRPAARWGRSLGPLDGSPARRHLPRSVAANGAAALALSRLWRLRPDRTAAALVELARRGAGTSPGHRRRSLTSAMLDRLDALCRSQGTQVRV